MYLNILIHFVIGNESTMRKKEMEIIDEQQRQSENTPSRRERCHQISSHQAKKASQQRESYSLLQTGEYVCTSIDVYLNMYT